MNQVTNQIKVLITDDHSLFRIALKNALAKRPEIKIVGEAVNGQDLLNQLKAVQTDIIFLGIAMPVMDGLTVLPILRKQYPGVKVIMLTMHNDPGVICRAIELGANAYLTKDVDSESIYKAIDSCCRNWFYINDTVRNAISIK